MVACLEILLLLALHERTTIDRVVGDDAHEEEGGRVAEDVVE